MDYTRITMRAAMKALKEVVTPAVDSTGQSQAMEQVRLVTDFLNLAEQRIHLIADRERFQLRESIELARKLEHEVAEMKSWSTLQAARTQAEAVLLDAHSDGPAHRRVTAELESAVRRVVIESADLPDEQRRPIETAVLAATTKRIEADRSWLLPYGFEAEPDSAMPVHTALGISAHA